ncbi:hypothetical protein PsorP6_005476 [Peronosclerospora sorghi]|uniref:Uncharacterized protein n=1 Tax=Peronosclerospora sorghi TaxID=230839 RepID=A0ACC0W252_9STRA|nr:hypothetical protein PsorP6_005476 [Peronosclerospora sorghi]
MYISDTKKLFYSTDIGECCFLQLQLAAIQLLQNFEWVPFCAWYWQYALWSDHNWHTSTEETIHNLSLGLKLACVLV